MFGKRKREQERERGRRVGRALAKYMDEIEASRWAGLRMLDEAGLEAARRMHPAAGVVEVVEHLMAICEGNANDVLAALEAWRESRENRFEAAGDEDRASHVPARSSVSA